MTTTVPARPAILKDLVSIAAHAASLQVDGFVTHLCDILRQWPDERAALAARHLARHGAAFRRTLAAEFGAGLRREAFPDRRAAAKGPSAAEEADLAKASFETMESQVLIDMLAHALDAAHADLLAPLRMRLAALQLDDPFRPDVFLRIFAAAWDRSDVAGASSPYLLGRMQPQDFLALAPVYAALDQALITKAGLSVSECMPGAVAGHSTAPDQLGRWLATGGAAEYPRRACALMNGMFALLAQEPALAGSVRKLLAGLRPALLDAVLSERDFFLSQAHPGRRLLDAVLHCAPAVPEEAAGDVRDHPVLAMLADLVQRLSAGDAGESAAKRLTTLAQACESRLAEEAGAAANALTPFIAAALRQERAARAREAAAADVSALLEPVEVAGFIGTFLETQWTRVLGLAHTLEESRPETLRKAHELMEDLVLSVRPDLAPDTRKAVLGKLPALLAGLNAWLNIVKWEGPERERFFAALAAHHAMLMRANGALSSRSRLHMAIDAAQSASERRLNQQALEQQAADAFVYAVDRFEPGAWLVFRDAEGRRSRARLAWISPWRTRFIFTGWGGKAAFSLASDRLAQCLREGKVLHIPGCGIRTEALMKVAFARLFDA